MATDDGGEYTFSGFDAFQVQAGDADADGRGGGDYTDWVGLVREVLRPRLDTVEDFLPDAVISDPDQLSLIVRYIELGKQQLNAPVNNRRENLSRLKNELRILNVYLDKGTMELGDEMPSKNLKEVMDYLEISEGIDDEAVRKATIEDVRNGLHRQARLLYEGMQRDKELGQFVDYGELKDMFAGGPQGGHNVGSMAMRLPYFLSMAFTACRATETNTRRTHAQAALARQIYYAKGAQGGGPQRKRRQRRSTGGMFEAVEDEE